MATRVRYDTIDTGESEMADFTEAIREMVEYMKANPEYRAKVEKAGKEFARILEQSDKDFEAIRQGTYRPKGE